MTPYEALYIITATEQEEQERLMDRFKGIVEEAGGEVESVNPWGQRKLAYEINKHREGFYVVMNFKGTSRTVLELERNLKLADEVIRYLVTRQGE